MTELLGDLSSLSDDELKIFFSRQKQMMEFLEANFLKGGEGRKFEFFRTLREAHTETADELATRGLDAGEVYYETDKELEEKWR